METAGKLESDGGFESGPRNWEWGGGVWPVEAHFVTCEKRMGP